MGKLIGILFFGVFAVSGIGFFISGAAPMLSGWAAAKSWEPVQAELISHKLDASYSDDSTTYNVIASYRYDYLGQSFSGARVGFAGGSDNIGSYHQDIDRELKRVKRGDLPLQIWVNPDDPSEAVIDRGIRWGLLAFKSIFLFVFGGVGIGGLYAMYRFRNLGEVLPDADPTRPWTQYSEWNSDTILSNAKLGNSMMLIFALIWNLISWPTVLAIVEPVSKGELLPLIALIFPAVGLYLIWLWLKGHRAYKLTGPMPLKLNPYPASIGGQVGGVISISSDDLTQLSNLRNTARITLEYVRHYQTGSGDNRKTRHDVLYEQSMVPSIARVNDVLELRFCFDLESSHQVSEAPLEMPRKTWRIRMKAESDNGILIERDYDDIPVFATDQQSSINDTQAYVLSSTATQQATAELVEAVFDLQPSDRGYTVQFAAYQDTSMLMFGLIGVVFCAIGLVVPHLLFNIVFPLIGGILALIGIYCFIRSLDVRIGAEGITSVRGILGYRLEPKFLPSFAFKGFEKKSTSSSTSGNKTTKYYEIYALGDEGVKVRVAEGLEGLQEADAAIVKLQSLFDYTAAV